MKQLATAILIFFISNVNGQEFDGHQWDPPYTLTIPDQWTIERFLIPIGFAPEIPYKGVEEIRFSPGWAKSTEANYWSYAFLWFLEGSVKMDAKTIEQNLKNYYTGLVKINGGKISADKIIPVVTQFKETKKANGDMNTWEGSVKMTDYMSGQPIVLNCRVHLKSCRSDAHTYLFYELSPQPVSHSIWKEMNKLWSDFKCKK